MIQQKYVLAAHIINKKDFFVYHGGSLEEIMGASQIISNLIRDYLLPAAKEYCKSVEIEVEDGALYQYPQCKVEENLFSHREFQKRIEDGAYIGEVVCQSDWGALVLYKDRETYVGVNQKFTKKLLERLDTLWVPSACVELENFENFALDCEKLFRQYKWNKVREYVGYPVNALPFVETSSKSGRPYTGMIQKAKVAQKVTKMEWEKYNKYYEMEKSMSMPSKAELLGEKLLAFICIDNDMETKLLECLKNSQSYDGCVSEIRGVLEEQNKERENEDWITLEKGVKTTILCKASDALNIVKTQMGVIGQGNVCVGIAMFQSYVSYSSAYQIAEECCENAKKLKQSANLSDVGFLDFEYIRGGVDRNLGRIREREQDVEKEKIRRPWILKKNREKSENNQEVPIFTKFDVEQLKLSQKEVLQGTVNQMVRNLKEIGRSNTKKLREAAEIGSAEFEMELRRINAHRKQNKQIDFSLDGKLDEEKRSLIYDMAIIDDIWFGEEKL